MGPAARQCVEGGKALGRVGAEARIPFAMLVIGLCIMYGGSMDGEQGVEGVLGLGINPLV